ncbi:phosphatidylinositol N-acetylglucosaminyltransferase subunit Y [Polychytrium aggregatum]|uniref:phosphatidylinositol N-acetylglucosaminyltransferase subunit Y n=1 Tax=Polychytrium aggregatum TaxID=110093 RepID=UPI0022FDC7C7|nr:phosphatidylinositol N-acetylglucosaminyltransferase subunit Y [Polychytrium aggregatum]KAI9209406.1 phosphatidylinositol N-acetylglucosaminyltransferase subunit Y [Polychytrium aggregatum]
MTNAGLLLAVATSVYFVSAIYSICISKWLPYTGIWVLDWVKDDTYYCLLLPILGPVMVYFVFFNWLGMKFFRTN